MTTKNPQLIPLPPSVDWDKLTEGPHFVRLPGRQEPYLPLPGLLALAGQVGRLDSEFVHIPTQVAQGVWLAVYQVTLTLPDGTARRLKGWGMPPLRMWGPPSPQPCQGWRLRGRCVEPCAMSFCWGRP